MSILILPLFFLINSCNDVCSCKKVACPAFSNPDFDSWFPYREGQKLLFGDSPGFTDTINITYSNRSASYEAKKGCMNGAAGCSMQALQGSADSSYGGNEFMAVYNALSDWGGSITSENIELRLYGFTATATGIRDTGLVGIHGMTGLHSRSYAGITLGAVQYGQVQVLEADTTNFGKAGIYKVYLSRNTGIIAYEEYPSLLRRVKQ